ncbi:MAG: extracellular solute-binding protein [Oscillospiraceae bacterium]|nr:extracellular solute-binding protein [Oscillospiraceae bacterium]
MNKKILAALLAAAMLASIATSCGDKKEEDKPADSGKPATSTGSTDKGDDKADAGSDNVGAEHGFTLDPAGYPIMDEPLTVKAAGFCTMPEGVDAWETPNEIYFFKTQEERTNIHIEWDNMTSAALKERMPIMFAGDDLPDIFWKGSTLAIATAAKYGNDGMLVDLTPYLEDYAPDLYKILSERDQLKFMTYAGGIWGFPYYFESEGIRMSKILVNKKWCDNMGIEIPGTWDELTDMLVAFREGDPNGNGDTTDEQPCCLSSVGHVANVFAYGKYNLGNRGSSMGGKNIDADPADASGNTLRFYPMADEMKEVYRDVKEWWDMGILEPTLFDTDYWDLCKGKLTTDAGGMFGSYATAAGNYTDDFVGMASAPGETWNYVQGYLSGLTSGMITKNCTNVPAMVAYFNYAYTMEGAYEYFLGVEGESYTIDADGHVQLGEVITNHPELEQEQAHLRWSYYSGGGNPGLATDETFKGGETHIVSLNANNNFRPATEDLVIWESFPLNDIQTEAINGVSGDIDTVIAEYRAAFITGTKDIDADWDAYIADLKAAGVDTYVEAYQAAYDALNG